MLIITSNYTRKIIDEVKQDDGQLKKKTHEQGKEQEHDKKKCETSLKSQSPPGKYLPPPGKY